MLMGLPRWTCSWCRRSRAGLLYGLLIMGHGRRQLLWFGVTAHPTAEWIANQLTEAVRLGANPSLPNPGSRWCIRRDIYPPRSIDRHSRPPDVSAFTLAKRIRRTVDRLDPQECLDHIVVFGERHLRHVLLSYMDYYNGTRTHLSFEQGRADITCRRGSGAHSVPSDPGWTASPICSG